MGNDHAFMENFAVD